MNDMNQLNIIGRLTKDAEIKYTQGGTAIGKFSIASNRSVKKGDKWEDEANFFECTMFGKSAENLSQYLTKGQQVAINGELRQERWEKDGQKQSKVTIIVNHLQLIGGKSEGKENNGQEQNRYKKPDSSSSPEGFDFGPESFDDSSIPF